MDLSGGRGDCLKQILRRGTGSGRHPPLGSTVSIYYDIVLHTTGEPIHSTSKDEPFSFILGQDPSEAIPGWELAVASMERGEEAEVICAPELAYGEAGAPPKIPPSATLRCRLELLDWVSLGAYTTKVETDEDLQERWRQEIAEGTSPIKDSLGMDKAVQDATDTPKFKDKVRILDLASEEARKNSASMMCGYADFHRHIEKKNWIEVFFSVPLTTRKEDVEVTLKSQWLSVGIRGEEPLGQGKLAGGIRVDGSFWQLTDASLEQIDESNIESSTGFEISTRPDDLCISVYLEKRPPSDHLWGTVFKQEGPQ